MSEIVTFRQGDQHIAPYLHPDYWGGHTIGQGQQVEGMDSHLVLASNQVKMALADYLDRPGPRFPLRVYAEGERFDPNDYDHGVVVAMRHEELIVAARRRPPPQIDYKDRPLPLRDRSIPEGKNFAGHCLRIRDERERYHYYSAAQWGVVIRSEKEKRGATLVHVMPGAVFYEPPQSYIDGPFMGRRQPFIIGSVVHRQKSDCEAISRHEALEICSTGLPQVERQVQRSWLGQLGLAEG